MAKYTGSIKQNKMAKLAHFHLGKKLGIYIMFNWTEIKSPNSGYVVHDSNQPIALCGMNNLKIGDGVAGPIMGVNFKKDIQSMLPW